MSFDETTSPTASMLYPGPQDLTPIAWLLPELRRCLDGAAKAVQQFVRTQTESDGAALGMALQTEATGEDGAQHLLQALHLLHQSQGALEMVGQGQAALLVRAMEAAVQAAIDTPAQASYATASTLSAAGVALVQYWEALLAGQSVSPVALFTQYRDVLALRRQENKAHPGDLWQAERRLREPQLPRSVGVLQPGPAARAAMDAAVLHIVKGSDVAGGARRLREVCMALAEGQATAPQRTLWKVAAGFFDALSQGLVHPDVYAKRAASRVLLQYAALAKGDDSLPQRLLQDLLFYCAQAAGSDAEAAAAKAPVWAAVHRTFGLERHRAVDYEQAQYGLLDPAQLAQARRQLTVLTEAWSSLAGGEAAQLQPVVDHMQHMGDAVLPLLPQAKPLVDALNAAAQRVWTQGRPPGAALGMEVATAVLYLQAVLAGSDSQRAQAATHCNTLADRVQAVSQGYPQGPVAPWMEQLYRQSSESQTMGSVVGELWGHMSSVEQALDAYFRQPDDATAQQGVGAVLPVLGTMRGVLSVLGLEPASQGLVRMRQRIERLLAHEVPDDERAACMAAVGESVGTLGFVIDMLSYQRHIARHLYVLDESDGVLKLVMGRLPDETEELVMETPVVADLPQTAPADSAEAQEAAALPDVTAAPATELEPVSTCAPAPTTEPTPELVSEPAPDPELLDVFVGEAREVLAEGQTALQALEAAPNDAAQQAALRRVFHTLKGSARMVPLPQFSEASWALERVVHEWFERQAPMPQGLRQLSKMALDGLAQWVDAIAAQRAHGLVAAPFEASAQTWRSEGRVLPLPLMEPGSSTAPAPALESAPPASLTATATATQADSAVQPLAASEAASETASALDDFAALLQQLPPALATPAVADTAAPSTEEHLATSVASPATQDVGPDPLDLLLSPAAGSRADTEPAAHQQVGDVAIPQHLFTVFLAEADRWSEQLRAGLLVWQVDPQKPQLPDLSVWAHALGGSAATVGLHGISTLAKQVEAVLEHLQPQGCALPAQLLVLLEAAETLRSLLHQCAAGQLGQVPAAVTMALQQLLQMPVQQLVAPPPAPEALEAEIDAAIAQAMALDDLDDADIDVYDGIEPDLFPVFEEEAQELLPAMVTALQAWEQTPDDASVRGQLLRHLHTFKGSARLAGALRLGELAHRLESAVELLVPHTATADDIRPLHARVAALQAGLNVLRAVGAQSAADPQAGATAPLPDAPVLSLTTTATDDGTGSRHAAAPQASVRVRTALLDRLVAEAGEVMMARARLEARLGHIKGGLGELTLNIERLRRQLRELELQSESQMQSRLQRTQQAAHAFDPLELDRFTRVQELSRMLAESVNDVATVQRHLLRDVAAAEDEVTAQGHQARELQRDLLRTRMVAFDALAERLYAVVRQAAKDTGKQVKLNVIGGSLEMDRGVLERLAPALEHLLRNSVDHGIEAADVRAAAGKPVAGTITVQVEQEGNDVAVCCSDDGAGLPIARIQDKAQAMGLLAPGETLDAERAAQLVLLPGVTTATTLTDVSGRGIGMDVVREQVQALGGRIETATATGQGTAFRLVLPLTTAVTQVVLLRMGSFTVAVPAQWIEVVRRVDTATVDAALASGQLPEAEGDVVGAPSARSVPLYWGGAVWGQSARSREGEGSKTRPVVVVHSAAQRVALLVDEVQGHQEVVVKPLGVQLQALPGLTGMSVLPSGQVLLIYNPVALLAVHAERIAALVQSGQDPLPPPGSQGPVATPEPELPTQADGLRHAPWAAGQAAPSPLVLVVDDSITVRRVAQRLLQREGLRVASAADGAQALAQIARERPCVVLSDIEMPVMDGFALLQALRADAATHDLPVVMITSRTAQKHRTHAQALGAQHYLGKPYAEATLLALVQHYAHGTPLPDDVQAEAALAPESEAESEPAMATPEPVPAPAAVEEGSPSVEAVAVDVHTEAPTATVVDDAAPVVAPGDVDASEVSEKPEASAMEMPNGTPAAADDLPDAPQGVDDLLH